MKKLFLVLGLTALWATISPAQAQTIDKDTAKQQGGQLGTALNPSVTQGIKTGNPSTVVPGYNTNPTQKQYFQGGQGSTVGPGTTRVAGCTNQSDIECQAVNLMRQGPQTRPQFNITRSDPLLGRSKSLTNNPGGQIGDIFSSYGTCKTTTTTTSPTFETQVCNEFSVNEDKVCVMGQQVVVDPDYLYTCQETIQSQANRTCTVGRIVQVDADYNYQCQQSPKQIETLTCNKTLIVTCDPQVDGCDSGGIVPGSTQGDMRVWFGAIGGGTYGLEFGTFADNYWGGYGAVYDRTLQFNIANKDGVTQFSLINASFDDWLLVRVNGTLVYVGPYGGDRLEITSAPTTAIPSDGWCGLADEYSSSWLCWVPDRWRGSRIYGTYGYCERRGRTWYCGSVQPGLVQYGPSSYGSPELRTSWNRSLNIDLRPYLVTGNNVIFMRTIVAGGGEGAIRINARMACPRNCYDNWDNQCRALEQRAR